MLSALDPIDLVVRLPDPYAENMCPPFRGVMRRITKEWTRLETITFDGWLAEDGDEVDRDQDDGDAYHWRPFMLPSSVNYCLSLPVRLRWRLESDFRATNARFSLMTLLGRRGVLDIAASTVDVVVDTEEDRQMLLAQLEPHGPMKQDIRVVVDPASEEEE